jgi:broad specificity phosphatase PhoE
MPNFIVTLRIIYFLIFVLYSNYGLTQVNYDNSDIKTTYFLIRHSEKDRSNHDNKNPHLTKKGAVRAENWSKIFNYFDIDAVYSTDFKRTLETAFPIAKSNNLNVIKYHPINLDVNNFISTTKGKNVVIVGHSNTIPNLANKIIGKKIYEDIEDSNNANLYIITMEGKAVSHVLIKLK